MKRKHSKAFTLVEILIVIAIIGILFIAIVSRVDFATDKAKTAGVQTDFRSIQAAVYSLASEQGEIVRDNQQLIILLNNKLDQELQLVEEAGELYSASTDPWGNRYKVSYATPKQSKGCLFIQSAGPDNKFDTADDLISSVTYSTAEGQDEIIIDNIDSNKKDEIISSADHVCVFNKQVVSDNFLATSATCANNATYYYSCSCGLRDTQTFVSDGSLKPHDFSAKVEDEQYLKTAATCQAKAIYYKSCTLCGAVSTETFESSKIGEHNNVFGGTENAHLVCQVCNTIVNTSHVFSTNVVREATCEIDGLTVTSCECGYSYETSISAGGHTHVFVGTADIHSKCTTCNQEIVTAHDFRETVVSTLSCTTDGYSQYDCECGYSKVERTDALGHKPGAEATCQAAQKCTRCNTILVAIKEHEPVGTVTCTTSKTCSMCNTVIEAATGHQNTEIRNLKPATPSTSGYTGDTYCLDCDTLISTGKTYSLTPGLYETGSNYTQLIKSLSSMKSSGWLDSNYKVVTSYRSSIAGDVYFNQSSLVMDAFYNCTNLTGIYTGTSTKSVGMYAFYGCRNLKDANFTSATSISNYAFSGCSSLQSVTAPMLNTIGGNAFEGCTNLTTFNADNVISISQYAFSDCTGLSNLNITFNNTSISNYAFDGCVGLINIDLTNVKTVGSSAFSGCTNLQSANLTNVQTLNSSAFSGCTELTDVIISRSLTHIGANAFLNCKKLNMTLKNGIYYLGDGEDDLYIMAMKPSSTSAKTYTVDESTSIYCYDCFSNCTNLESFTISENVVYIGANGFKNCSLLKSIYIPETIVDMGNDVFYGCDSFVSVGPYGSGCSVELPTRSTWGWWFNYCDGITTVIIPEGVTTLSRTFQGCKKLANVSWPDSLTSFSYAFASCTSIKSIGPKGSGAQVEIPDTVTVISNSAFSMCYLTSIIFPEQITELDSFSIHYNYLTVYELPKGLQYIGDYSIGDNTRLHTIYMGNAVKSIGKYSFRGLGGLKTIYYDGTMAEWNAIRKGTEWNIGCNEFTVVCSDGNVTIPANDV